MKMDPMRFLDNLSIRYKQILIIMLTSTIGLLLACSGFVAYEILTFRRALAEDVSLLAEVVGSNCATAIDFDDPLSALETLEALRASPNIVSAAVYTANGMKLARYERDEVTELAPPFVAPSAGHEFLQGHLQLSRQITVRGDTVGTIFIASDLEALIPRVTGYLQIAGGVLIAALFVAFVVSNHLQRLISGPIVRLAGLTKTVAEGEDFSVRATVEGNNELSRLTAGFNTMLDRIQERDQALREARDKLEERVVERTVELEDANKTIAKERARFEFIFDSVPIGIAWSNKESGTVLVNRAHERISGVPREDMKRPNVFQHATHPDDRPRQEILAAKFRKNEIDRYSIEKRYVHPDGRTVWVDFSGRRIRDPNTGEMHRIATLVDITARKQMDEKLRYTEELYRRAIAGAGAVPYCLDYNTNSYTFLGEGITGLIGYPPEEVGGKLWRNIIQEAQMLGETEGMDKEVAARMVADGKFRTWRCDMRVRTREGKLRWLADVSVQNLDESGAVTGSMGILQDITERKQAEIAASVFSRLGQDLAAAATPIEAARIVGNIADKLLGWDAYGVALFSEEQDLIQGILNIDLVDGRRTDFQPPPANRPTELARRVFQEGPVLVPSERTATFASDSVPFGNVSRPSATRMYAPIRHGERLVGLITIQSYTPNAYGEADLATLQDLADRCGGAMERIRAEEARRKSETQFRLVWESSADGMLLADAEGKIHAVNDAYCRMVDIDRAKLLGQSITIVEPQERRETVLQDYRKRLDSGDLREYLETRTRLWNGREVWFEITDSRLDIPGETPLLLSIFRDITNRKKAEAELTELHKQIVDASRQAGMAEIATNVLHNVGNVLNSVNVSTNLLGESVRLSRISRLPKLVALLHEHSNDPGSFFESERGRQCIDYLDRLSTLLENDRKTSERELHSLRTNIAHIKDIITMQQSYARVSAVKEVVDVKDLVEDSLRLNALSLKRHDVRVVRDYNETPATAVEKHKVIQILVNLVRNAKYACDDSGRDDKRLTVGVDADSRRIRVFVTDNGVGIPKENLTRIFHHGFTTRKDGHGFGLHSAAIAAGEMGGKLSGHSAGPGKGATFTLQIPIESAPRSSSPPRGKKRAGPAPIDRRSGGDSPSLNHIPESLS